MSESLPRPQRRLRVADIGGRTVVFLIVLGFSALFAFPLYWMIVTSLKLPNQVFAVPTIWWPSVMQFSNWPAALRVFPFVRDLINSLIITVPSTVGMTIASALVAYGLTRLRWRGRSLAFVLILSTLMVPSWVTLVPLYILFNDIGMVNTFWPLILPQVFGGAFSIFLMRQFFMQQPHELFDAARVDGASHIRMFVQIALPLAKPALAVVALFAFINSWTDYINPLVYLSNSNLFTLQLGLFNFFNEHNVNWPGLMAASLIVMMPMVILFLAAQRSFIEGVTFTGLRG